MNRNCCVVVTFVLAASSLAAEVATMPTSKPAAVSVRGRVVAPDGTAVAGASVTVPTATPDGWGSHSEVGIVARATSGADGRFAVDFDPMAVSPIADGWKRVQLLAIADGRGVAWRTWDDVYANGDVVLTLVDDRPVEGRIVDADGKPLAGVELVVNSVATAETEAEFAAAIAKDPRSPERLIRWLPLASAGLNVGATTDADGRFKLVGLGANRTAGVQMRGPNVGYGTFKVRTRDVPTEVTETPQPIGWSTRQTFYGARFEHRATRAQAVEGVVRDAATGDPVPGVVVQSHRLSDPEHTLTFDPTGVIRATTDANGRYRLAGFPAGAGNKVFVLPPLEGEVAYFMRELELPEGKDETLDVELHRGVWLAGKVTDKQSGAPVQARLFWTTYLDNPFAANVPEFRRGPESDAIEGVDSMQNRYETQADGTYRMVVLPGPGIVWTWSSAPGYRMGDGWDEIAVLKDARARPDRLFEPQPYGRDTLQVVREVRVPENVAVQTLDLAFDRGATVRVNVVDADGKPAAGSFQVRGTDPERYMGWHGKESAGPTFETKAWAADETRTVWVVDDANRRGAALPVTFATVRDGAVTLRLQPTMTVSGRVLGKDGKPLAKAELEAAEWGGGGQTLRMVTTDADGRFTTTLVAGVDYYVQVWSGSYAGNAVVKELKVQPGATRDLGDVRLTRTMRE